MKVGILIGGAIIGLIGIVLVLNFARVGTKADDQQAVTKAATSTAAEWLALVDGTGNTARAGTLHLRCCRTL
jgi:hypothetical protein